MVVPENQDLPLKVFWRWRNDMLYKKEYYTQSSMITLKDYQLLDAGPEDAPEFGAGIYWTYVYTSTMSEGNKDRHQYKDKTNKDIRGYDVYTVEGMLIQGVDKY